MLNLYGWSDPKEPILPQKMQTSVWSLCGKVLKWRGYRGNFCGKMPEAVHSISSFKADLLLDKAEPISDTGNPSGITHLRREKNYCATAAGREE